VTLRYPYEVRKEEDYFDDIPDEKVPKDMLELATHIVETKAGHFNPKTFDDRYEDALKELLKKKQSGQKIERPTERAPAKVINLMDALRRSVQAERGAAAAPKKGKNRAEGQKEMLLPIEGKRVAREPSKRVRDRAQDNGRQANIDFKRAGARPSIQTDWLRSCRCWREAICIDERGAGAGLYSAEARLREVPVSV
jgi:DNA end-binding protein Ku